MRFIYVLGASLLIIIGLVAAVSLRPIEQSSNVVTNTDTNTSNKTSTEQPENMTTLGSGRYLDYQADAAASNEYDKTILFFYAPWCPECRAFEQAIQTSSIPDGVQILKVDYDNSSDLKKKYRVTLQTTFVHVDSNGNKLSLWVGYEKDKSIDIILENT
jgi:thiol-disulfide isomerase/thioredoxin